METKQNFGISEGIFSFCSSNGFLQDMGHWRSQFSKHHQCSILPNKIEDIMLNFFPVCFKSPCKLFTPRSKADSDQSDPKFLPKQDSHISLSSYIYLWDLGINLNKSGTNCYYSPLQPNSFPSFLLKLFICRALYTTTNHQLVSCQQKPS
jgi:hypothetical protein